MYVMCACGCVYVSVCACVCLCVFYTAHHEFREFLIARSKVSSDIRCGEEEEEQRDGTKEGSWGGGQDKGVTKY